MPRVLFLFIYLELCFESFDYFSFLSASSEVSNVENSANQNYENTEVYSFIHSFIHLVYSV